MADTARPLHVLYTFTVEPDNKLYPSGIFKGTQLWYLPSGFNFPWELQKQLAKEYEEKLSVPCKVSFTICHDFPKNNSTYIKFFGIPESEWPPFHWVRLYFNAYGEDADIEDQYWFAPDKDELERMLIHRHKDQGGFDGLSVRKSWDAPKKKPRFFNWPPPETPRPLERYPIFAKEIAKLLEN